MELGADVTQPRVDDLAGRARIDKDTALALKAFVSRLPAPLAVAAAELSTKLTLGDTEAIALRPTAEAAFGSQAPLYYLWIALQQIPHADELHRRKNIPAEISEATWRDVSVWCRHLWKREARRGITWETLEWLQHALRGHLFRIGSTQFELQPFPSPWCVFRQKETQSLVVAEMAPGPDWVMVLPADSPVLRMHIPQDTWISLPSFVKSTRAAIQLFTRLHPSFPPLAVFGDAWLFDPAARSFLPDTSRLDDLCRICTFFPGEIPELKTIRRFFGSSATRASLKQQDRALMNSLQRALADFLSDDANALRSRRALVLFEDLNG